jgi:DNA-binding NtrC family response regulator
METNMQKIPPHISVNTSSAVLVVESDPVLAGQLCRWLEGLGVKVVLARSADEATHLLYDVMFIGCSLDGMLVDYKLRESTGCRILYEFRREYPLAPVALMIDAEDISISVWARARSVQLLRKPIDFEHLILWVKHLGVAV